MSAVTERNGDHAAFDELVAGYALDALDPADERLFLTHLPGCRRCQHALGDYLEITAALAGTGPGGPGQPAPAGAAAPRPHHGRRGRRPGGSRPRAGRRRGPGAAGPAARRAPA